MHNYCRYRHHGEQVTMEIGLNIQEHLQVNKRVNFKESEHLHPCESFSMSSRRYLSFAKLESLK